MKNIFLGIDPGTRMAGYGLISQKQGEAPIALAAGAWKLNAQLPLCERLGSLARGFRELVHVYKPTHMCLELSFVSLNPRTALYLGHARGVFLSEAYLAGLCVSELSATSVKKTVTGYGRASKEDLAKNLTHSLSLKHKEALPLDATDALAVAYAAVLLHKIESIKRT